jgi:hypothetical protein
MIQFNLLPDVKIEYVKAMRVKRMVIGAAAILTASTFAIFLLLAIVAYGVQKATVSNLDNKIETKSKELRDTKDLDKILTIQNQLNQLPGLHDKKVVATRAFGFLQQLTPVGITVSDYTVDFAASTMTITGESPALDRVNVFADTLKYAQYTDGKTTATTKPFSKVVLAQFGRTTEATTYTITLSFVPDIFKNNAEYALIIPKGPTTNSITGQPASLFKASSSTGQGN